MVVGHTHPDLERAAGVRRGDVLPAIDGQPVDSLIVTEPTPFTRITHGLAAYPGTFVWTEPVTLTPRRPGFTGQLIVLVDEETQCADKSR